MKTSKLDSALTRSAAKVALGTILSRILGLIRDVMIARAFPPLVRDAFIVAFRLPNFFRRIFGEGSLSAALVPVFIDSRAEPRRARELLNSSFTLLSIITFVFSALGMVFMQQILEVLVSGQEFMRIPGKFALTLELARVMFGFVAFISLTAYITAILSSFRRFFVAAVAPCIFNLTLIAAAFVRPGALASEKSLAWAVVIGGALQTLVLVPALRATGVKLRFSVPRLSPDLRRIGQTVLPAIFGVSLMQLTMLINIHFASYLPQGAHTYLYLADRLIELPLALFVLSMGSVLLPSLSQMWSEGRQKEMSDAVNQAVRVIVLFALPAAVGLFILALPITETLFLGREFSYEDVVQTSHLIQIYAFLLLSGSTVRVLAQGFYAMGNAWFPALAAGVSLISHIILAFALTHALGLPGLALATLASSFVNAMMLSLGHTKWVGSLQWRPFSRSLFLSLPGLAVLIISTLVYRLKVQGMRFAPIPHSVVLAAVICVSAGFYFLGCYLFHVKEIREALKQFKR